MRFQDLFKEIPDQVRNDNSMDTDRIVSTFITKSGKQVVIRYPKLEDVDEALRLINSVVAEDIYIAANKPYTRETEEQYIKSILQEITQKRAAYLFAFYGDKLVGNCSLIKGPGRKAHMGMMGVIITKEFRFEGIGKRLIECLIEEGRKLGITIAELQVFNENKTAIDLYTSLGFIEAGRIPKTVAYHDRMLDEIWMYKTLT